MGTDTDRAMRLPWLGWSLETCGRAHARVNFSMVIVCPSFMVRVNHYIFSCTREISQNQCNDQCP